MSLKDDAGLVKMYAFVDMEQYQVVGIGATVDKAKTAYFEALQGENIEVDPDETPVEQQTIIKGKVANLSSAVINGNTYYYVILEENENIYQLSASLSNKLPFLKVGDSIEITEISGEYRAVKVNP